MPQRRNGDGGLQAAPATTRSRRPMAEIPIFLRHAPVSTSTVLRSASTSNKTPSAIHFFIDCTSDSSSTSSGQNSAHSTTAQRRRRAPGCPSNDQIPPTDGRNSNLSSSRSCFHFHCTAFGFNAQQRHRQHSTSTSSAPVIRSSTSSGHYSAHATTAQRRRRAPGCPCNDQIPPTDG